jgi:hypothetical protein
MPDIQSPRAAALAWKVASYGGETSAMGPTVEIEYGHSDLVTHMNFGSTLVHNASVDFINLLCGTSAL